MHRDRRKTPQEMAAITAEIARQKKIQKAKDDLKNVKNGRVIIFVIAGILVLSSVLTFYALDQNPLVYVIYGPLIITFIVLGILYFRNPFGISVAALSIYGTLMLLDILTDPSQIVRGIVFKIIIISGLIRAIKYGKDYNAAKQFTSSGDILDADFTI